MKNHSGSLYVHKQATFNAKKYMFIVTFFVYVFVRLFTPLFMTVEKNSMGANPIGAPLAMLMFGVALLLTVSMRKERAFHSKGITIFFTGTLLWILYGWVVQIAGVSMYTTLRAYRALVSLSAFYAILILVSQIIILYDWRLELITIICLSLGITLMTAYMMNFDNFAFIGHLGDIFETSGRYRFAFGLGHVNDAGRLSMYFLVFSAIYREMRKERHQSSAKIDWFNALFIIPASVISVLILLSCASRTSITSLLLFFMVYILLTFWAKLGSHLRLIMAMSAVIIIVLLIVSVDWEYVFYMSNRASNYTALEVVARKKAWLTGLGFVNYPRL